MRESRCREVSLRQVRVPTAGPCFIRACVRTSHVGDYRQQLLYIYRPYNITYGIQSVRVKALSKFIYVLSEIETETKSIFKRPWNKNLLIQDDVIPEKCPTYMASLS